MKSRLTRDSERRRFAAVLRAAEERALLEGRSARTSINFVTEARPSPVGADAARAYRETLADGPQGSKGPQSRAVAALAMRETSHESGNVRLNRHDLMALLKHSAERARSVRELNKLRAVFAKGFHPDRRSGTDLPDRDAIMREANALIDATIANWRQTTDLQPRTTADPAKN